MIDATETKRVQRRDRPSAHGEDVAENSADAGGGALVGLDERRMIVAFHFKSHGQSIANIDDTRILPRALQNMRTFGGKPF
jgi:hypothetical protein